MEDYYAETVHEDDPPESSEDNAPTYTPEQLARVVKLLEENGNIPPED